MRSAYRVPATPGALAAWIGFTLPSALAMVLFGYGVAAFGDVAGAAWLHGLKVAAVAVVAQAVLGMARTLAPDRERATLAVVAAVIALAVPSSLGQIGAIVAWRRSAGLILPRGEVAAGQASLHLQVSRTVGDRAAGAVLRAAHRIAAARRGDTGAGPQGVRLRSIAPARWCSAAATSCCRCCRPRWFRRAG